MPLVPWIAVPTVLLLVAGALMVCRRARTAPRATAAPAEGAVLPRPVFDREERHVYQLLRDALPHHVILSKLSLARFCQPAEPGDASAWAAQLASVQVSFAVCSPNGRVLAAIDLAGDRSPSRRLAQLKQSVLKKCRIRYLRCGIDHLPSIAELQLLVPQPTLSTRGPQPASACASAVAAPPGARPRRAVRLLWQDATLFNDSFVGVEAHGAPADDLAPAAPAARGAGLARAATAPSLRRGLRARGARTPTARH